MDEINVSETTLAKIIEDHSLLAAGTYSAAEHRKLIDLCLIDVYRKLLSRPDVSEGGYSVRWTKEGLQAAIKGLYDKWGLSDPAIPKIRSVNVW